MALVKSKRSGRMAPTLKMLQNRPLKAVAKAKLAALNSCTIIAFSYSYFFKSHFHFNFTVYTISAMSVINQSVYFNFNTVLNSRLQSKYCVKLFMLMLSLSKETFKKPKCHQVNCYFT